MGATEAAPALRTGRFCTGRSSGFWAFVGPKRPKADAFWASCKFSFTFTRRHACMGPHPSVHRHSHAGSRRRPTLRGHGSIPLPATLGGWAASLEKTNACRWRANHLLDASAAQPMWKLGIVRLRPHRSSAMASLAVAGPDLHGTHVQSQADIHTARHGTHDFTSITNTWDHHLGSHADQF